MAHNMKLRINLAIATGGVLVVTLFQALAQTPTPLPTNCIAWWRAESNATDSIGFNDGILLNGATAEAVGFVGQAFGFDGTNDYFLVPDSSTLKPRNLTIEGWFNFRSVDAIHSLVARPIGIGNGNSYTLFYGNGALNGFTARPGSGNLAYLWTPTPGQWHHLAYTFDDDQDTEALYIDGVMVRSTNAPGSISYDNHPVLLGADLDYGNPSTFFGGLADEVAIYGRALTATELRGRKRWQGRPAITAAIHRRLPHRTQRQQLADNPKRSAVCMGRFNGRCAIQQASRGQQCSQLCQHEVSAPTHGRF